MPTDTRMSVQGYKLCHIDVTQTPKLKSHGPLSTPTGVTPNTCAQRPTQGGAQFAHANCVTHAVVRCSAWLGVTPTPVESISNEAFMR